MDWRRSNGVARNSSNTVSDPRCAYPRLRALPAWVSLIAYGAAGQWPPDARGEQDEEHARSERLLLNILPASISARLKDSESIAALRRVFHADLPLEDDYVGTHWLASFALLALTEGRTGD
mgnify:CR=1 FL=1